MQGLRTSTLLAVFSRPVLVRCNLLNQELNLQSPANESHISYEPLVLLSLPFAFLGLAPRGSIERKSKIIYSLMYLILRLKLFAIRTAADCSCEVALLLLITIAT